MEQMTDTSTTTTTTKNVLEKVRKKKTHSDVHVHKVSVNVFHMSLIVCSKLFNWTGLYCEWRQEFRIFLR